MISRLFFKIAKIAVGQLAQNPELRATASKVVKGRVVTRAKAGLKNAGPKLERAKDVTVSATKEVIELAKKNGPIKDPGTFLSEVSKKLRNRMNC